MRKVYCLSVTFLILVKSGEFKYLRPKELERQDIRCFDAWVAIFAKKTTGFEFNVTNNIVQKERFRYFIKVPELAAFYNEITDYRTAEAVGVDRPEKNERARKMVIAAMNEGSVRVLFGSTSMLGTGVNAQKRREQMGNTRK